MHLNTKKMSKYILNGHFLILEIISLLIHFYFPLQQKTMKVGFMTYDSKINFYNINGALTQPQQMTVGDVNDMFVPLADGLFVDAEEAEACIGK